MSSKLRCLFVVPDDPIGPNTKAGHGAVVYSHLALLGGSELFDTTLSVLVNHARPLRFHEFTLRQPETWNRVRGLCSDYHPVAYAPAGMRRSPLKHLAQTLSDPLALEIDYRATEAFQDLVAAARPDIIWAETLWPAVLAHHSVPGIPLLYSQLDWLWRIKTLRFAQNGMTVRSRWRLWIMRRIEEALIRRVSGCICVSPTEAADIRRIGQSWVHYLSLTLDPAPDAIETDHSPRLIHLGSMQTTATREGLARFLEVVWPSVAKPDPPSLWVIGSLKGASQPLLSRLRQANAVSTGFVPDLTRVLRPFDVQIVPWEHDTGVRTRIPLALSYGQVVVSTRSAGNLPELRSGENCILVDDLAEMRDLLPSLLRDAPRRQRIGIAAKDTFRKCFTRAAVQPRFNLWMRDFVSKHSSRRAPSTSASVVAGAL